MSRQALKTGFTGSRQLDDTRRDSVQVRQRLNACPFLDGFLVKGVTFAANTPRTIDHGLGARPRGCVVVRSYGANAAPPPVESATQPPDLTRQIALQTTAASTFDLWFF